MSTVKGQRAGVLAGILAGVVLTCGAAQAQDGFAIQPPSSILIYPKVTNTSDTVIQITNTTNSVTYAHCLYVNADQGLWQVTDFNITLTRQQPTHWLVSLGRPVNPAPPPDYNAGFDPGLIPPVPPGFTGFLICVEVGMDGNPVSANSLIGVATVGEVDTTSSMGKYNAVGIQGCNGSTTCGGTGGSNNGDNVLELNNVEYAACPGGVYLNFESEGGPDIALGAGSDVSTNIALVPCGLDFENLIPTRTVQSVEIRDEFENQTSITSLPVDCYLAEPLSATPPFSGQFSLPSTFGTAIIRPQVGGGDVPVVGVANVLRTASNLSSDTAITNLHFCTDADPPASCVTVNSEIRLSTFR